MAIEQRLGRVISRRTVIAGLGAASAVPATAYLSGVFADAMPALGPQAIPRANPETLQLNFNIAARDVTLPCLNGHPLSLLTFSSDPFPLVVRAKLGDTIDAQVRNGLSDPSQLVTIHWHGLRVRNTEDGVPFMTQQPVYPGSAHTYKFAPPDTGTFFFHTHCNSVEHFGRGLVAALIVDGDEVAPFDQDLVLMMKDWRIGRDGQFLPFTTDDGAAKGGTPGTIRSINGVTMPVYGVPANALVRLRVLNVDAARVSEIGIGGLAAYVIAVDGNACNPFPLEGWRMGPAMRVDLAVVTPPRGEHFQLIDYFAAKPVVLADFVSGEPIAGRETSPRIQPLRASRLPVANLDGAERLTFAFSATPTGQAIADLPPSAGSIPIGPLCLSKRTFWAINKRAWANADMTSSGPPLATLTYGKTYIFELINQTPRAHPIHIHGHTFKWLSSNLRTLPAHDADTILIVPKERVEVAIVAGNPGDWMFHCHLLEHQETGMMGYIRVV